jgi:hypothetical protein
MLNVLKTLILLLISFANTIKKHAMMETNVPLILAMIIWDVFTSTKKDQTAHPPLLNAKSIQTASDGDSLKNVLNTAKKQFVTLPLDTAKSFQKKRNAEPSLNANLIALLPTLVKLQLAN